MAEKNDIAIIQERETPMKDVSTDEVLTLMLGDEDNDVMFGRMSGGMDESEFDAMPRNEWDLTPEQAAEYGLYQGSNPTDPSATATTTSAPGSGQILGDDEELADQFSSPAEEAFPLYKR